MNAFVSLLRLSIKERRQKSSETKTTRGKDFKLTVRRSRSTMANDGKRWQTMAQKWLACFSINRTKD